MPGQHNFTVDNLVLTDAHFEAKCQHTDVASHKADCTAEDESELGITAVDHESWFKLADTDKDD